MLPATILTWPRRLFAAALLLGAFWLVQRSNQSGNATVVFVGSLFAICGLGIPAVLLTLPDILSSASRFLSKIFTSVYMPGDEVPPLDYSLARRMSKRREYKVAVREYLKILEYYPTEFDAYRELIQISLACDDTPFAAQVFERALKRLTTEKRSALESEFLATIEASERP